MLIIPGLILIGIALATFKALDMGLIAKATSKMRMSWKGGCLVHIVALIVMFLLGAVGTITSLIGVVQLAL